jgi:glucuronate isomerase
MSHTKLAAEMEEALGEVPILDPHTHLVGGRLGARGLHDLLLYHMVITDLYAAGCPHAQRLTEYPGWPSKAEAHARLEEAILYLPRIRNTSSYWAVRITLRDLFDWHEPITADNWRRVDAMIREGADDQAHSHAILDRLKIRRTVTEIARRNGGADDNRLEYELEWGFFTRCQWGEFDTALYELERCWGKSPDSPTPIGTGRRLAAERRIQSLDDVHQAMQHYLDNIPFNQVVATATGISTDINYLPVSAEEMQSALARRDRAGIVERDIYASYILELLLTGLEKNGDKIVFQFSLGAEPLPYETGCWVHQRTISQLAEIIARHPNLRIQCMNAACHINQSLCTLARELSNFSLIGFWWHSFFPGSIRQLISERLDMLPMNKQIGFFSDAYCVEWVYAKAVIVRKQLAFVLADKIIQGQFSQEDAVSIARGLLFESPQTLLRMVPRE